MVKAVTFWARDASANDAEVTLWKFNPATGGEVKMANFWTSGNAAGLRSWGDTTIAGNPLFPGDVPYLWVWLSSTGLEMVGIRIHVVWG